MRLNQYSLESANRLSQPARYEPFWLDPIALATNYGFNGRELSEIERLVEQHRLGLLEAWNEYLG